MSDDEIEDYWTDSSTDWDSIQFDSDSNIDVSIRDVDLDVENKLENAQSNFPDMNKEYSMSVEVEPDTEEVVCPKCKACVRVLSSFWLRLLDTNQVCPVCEFKL